MNDNFVTLANYYGFKRNASRAWGKYKEVPVSISDETLFFQVIVENSADVAGFLSTAKENGQIDDFDLSGFSMKIRYQNRSLSETKEFFESFIDFLILHQFRPVCGMCKQMVDTEAAMVKGELVEICDECFGKLKEMADKKPEVKPHSPMGYIGAILGAAIGGVIWVLIGKLGFIAAIAGFAIVYFALKGYNLFGGKHKRFTAFYIIVVAVLTVISAELISTFLIVQQELPNLRFNEQIKIMFDFILNEETVRFEFFKELAIGLLFTAFGAWKILRTLIDGPEIEIPLQVERV